MNADDLRDLERENERRRWYRRNMDECSDDRRRERDLYRAELGDAEDD